MPAPRRHATWLFGLLVLVSCWDLGGRNLHDADTARWGQLAREMVRTGAWLVPTRYGEVYANKPPLYLWAVAAPSALAGEVTPFWVRLPSALGLILMVCMTVWWARMRTGSREVGWLAGLLLLSTFLLAHLARSGRLDMFGAGLATAGAVLLDRAALRLGTRRTPWAAGLFLGLALLTKGPPLLLVPLAVLFVPSAGRSLRDRLRAARLHVIFGTAIAVALLWFVPAVLHGGWGYGEKLLFKQAADRLTGAALAVRPFGYYLTALPIHAAPWGLAYLGVCVLAWVPRGRRAFAPLGGMALAASLLTIGFTLIPTKHIRYLLPVVPVYVLPLAAWLAHRLALPPRTDWRRLLFHVSALAGVLGLATLVLGLLRADARLAATVPAGLLLATSFFGFRRRAASGGGADAWRRAATFGLLAGIAAVILAVGVLRPRYHEGAREHFNRELAALTAAGIPLYVGTGLTPENVFHGARAPHYPFDMTRPVPGPVDQRVLVVCRRDAVEALLSANPRPGRVLQSIGGRYQYALVGFGFP